MLIRNQSITTFETLVPGKEGIDYRNLVAMDLPRRDKFPVAEPQRISRFTMDVIEILQHRCLVVRQLDPRNPPHESVNTRQRRPVPDSLQRGKRFDR